MNVSLFSSPINIFKSLLKPSQICFVFSKCSLAQVGHIPSIRSCLRYPRLWTAAVFRACFKTGKSRDGTDTTLTTDFFYLRENNIHAMNNWNNGNNHFYSNDIKGFHTTQTTIYLIHSK